MEWFSQITPADAAIVFATLVGPVLAVQAQKWLERRRMVDDRRREIFRRLMATRAATLSTTFVEALNAIPVEFYGSRKELRLINEAWKLYLDHHLSDGTFSEVWAQKRIDLFIDLLHLISKFLGYAFSKAQLRSDIYSPRAHENFEADQNIIRQGLVSLFKGETALPLAIKEVPVQEPAGGGKK